MMPLHFHRHRRPCLLHCHQCLPSQAFKRMLHDAQSRPSGSSSSSSPNSSSARAPFFRFWPTSGSSRKNSRSHSSKATSAGDLAHARKGLPICVVLGAEIAGTPCSYTSSMSKRPHHEDSSGAKHRCETGCLPALRALSLLRYAPYSCRRSGLHGPAKHRTRDCAQHPHLRHQMRSPFLLRACDLSIGRRRLLLPARRVPGGIRMTRSCPSALSACFSRRGQQ